MKKQRRSFTQEFKQDAVRLVLKEGYKVAEAARSLDISDQMLGRWVRKFKANQETAFPGKGHQGDELQRRIRELEEENRQLKMEKDILKKATVNSMSQRNTSNNTSLGVL